MIVHIFSDSWKATTGVESSINILSRRHATVQFCLGIMESRSIAIVGAGVSGLVACKYALSKGFRPVVLESLPELGGAWASTLETTRLQTPKPFYQFSDFPWPPSVSDLHPTGDQVLDYLRAYGNHFDLLRHVSFSKRVLEIDFHGDDDEIDPWNCTAQHNAKWSLLVQDLLTLTQQVMKFDFVILCIGRFTEQAKMPEFPEGKGPEVFSGGEVMHSKDYSAMSNDEARRYIQGKRVVVVGFQKSALDVASEVAIANGKEKPCHLIYRTPRWFLPDFTAWGTPYSTIYLNRFAELLLHKPGESLFQSFLATILSPIRWVLNKYVESDIRHRTPLKKLGLVPQYNMLEAASSCVFAILPKGFYENVEEGRIVLKKTKEFSFCKDGVVIPGEKNPIKADLVIFATGFNGDQKLRNLFASSKFQDYIMGPPTSILPLYRQCIHPRIPRLAVIGYSESIANLFTSEMRSRWVMELLDGTFKLPTIKEMERDISRWDKYMKTYSPNHYRRSCIGLLHIWYNDQLCKDMGWNPKRKKGFFSELFEPYGPQDYINSS